MEEKNKVTTELEVIGAEKSKKKVKEYNKVVEEGTQAEKENTKATEQNTNAQNKNNQAKSKGAKSNGEYSSALKSISSKLTLNNLMVMAKAITTVAQKTIELTKYSVDYIENLNLMDTAFGKNSESARKWVKSISNIYGFDESTMSKQLGTFRQFGSALGFASDKADLLSKNLTLMAGDISSLYNINFSQASEKLTSALTGQTKAIRSLGADITQASLQQELYRLGINKSISDMNRAEKTLLIYISLERQLANSQGDLAKTLESPSNQMKVFSEQVKRLARSIGNLLLPVLAAILPIVNGVLAALTELFNLLASLFGIDMKKYDFGGAVADIDTGVDDLSDSLDAAGDSADKLKKKLLGLRGFDKLNVITTPTSTKSSSGGGVGSVAGGGIDSKLLDSLKEYNAHLDLAGKKVQKIRDMILGWFGYTVNENGELVKLNTKATKIQKIFKLIGSIGKDIYDILVDIVEKTVEWGKSDKAKKMFSDIGDIVLILLGWVKKITEAIKELFLEYINPMLPDVYDILALIVGIVKDILEYLTPIFDMLVTLIKWNLEGVLEGIKIALKGIKGTLENIKLMIEKVGKAIKQLAEGDFSGAIKTIKDLIKQMVENMKKSWGEVIEDFKENFIPKMKEHAETVAKNFEVIADWFKKLPERLGYLIGQITGKIIKFFTDPDYRKEIGEKIKDKIIKGITFLKKNVGPVIEDLIEKLKNKIKNADWWEVGKTIGEAILKAIFFPQYKIYEVTSSLISSFTEGIKNGINSVVGGKSSSSSGGGGGFRGIGGRAEGGFVDTGELFIAREAGPELVGSIGNKTAVANNDQIVQAVSIGVQNAIARSGMGNAKVVIEARGDSSGLMDFITFKQKQQERQYGL